MDVLVVGVDGIIGGVGGVVVDGVGGVVVGGRSGMIRGGICIDVGRATGTFSGEVGAGGKDTGRSGEDLIGAVDVVVGNGLSPFTLAGTTGAGFLLVVALSPSASPPQLTLFVVVLPPDLTLSSSFTASIKLVHLAALDSRFSLRSLSLMNIPD